MRALKSTNCYAANKCWHINKPQKAVKEGEEKIFESSVHVLGFYKEELVETHKFLSLGQLSDKRNKQGLLCFCQEEADSVSTGGRFNFK